MKFRIDLAMNFNNNTFTVEFLTKQTFLFTSLVIIFVSREFRRYNDEILFFHGVSYDSGFQQCSIAYVFCPSEFL